MVNVDPTFNTLVTSDNVQTRIRIYFIPDSVDCTDDNDVMNNGTLLVYDVGDTDSNKRVAQDGITLRELFNKETDIQMGDTVSAELDITFVNDDGALDNFAFGRCKVFLDAYDSVNNIWYPCPIGVFLVDTPIRRKVQLIESVAYDQMQKLDAIADEWFTNLDWSGGITLYDLVTEMATELGFHVSTGTATAMVNSTLSFTEQPFYPTEMTYREILAWIAGASCTYARFDRDGYLDLAWFDTVSYSVNADTIGNTCLKIDPSEYAVAQIDKLQVLGTESDVGVIIGTGTNAYKILNNGFLFGQDEAEITTKATPIYNRLSAFASYTPVSTTLIADWSVQAGDIIQITYDSVTYDVPIFQQTLSWRGAYVKSELFSSGNPIRTEMSAMNRSEYRAGHKVHTLENTVDSLVSTISDMMGNLSSIEQTLNSITSRVQDAEGNISTLQQTSTQLVSDVRDMDDSLTSTQTSLSQLWDFKQTVTLADGTVVSISEYIRFLAGEIVLGKSGSNIKLRLSSDKIIFFSGEDFDPDVTVYAEFNPSELWDLVVKALSSMYVGDDTSTNNFKISKTAPNGYGEFTIARI